MVGLWPTTPELWLCPACTPGTGAQELHPPRVSSSALTGLSAAASLVAAGLPPPGVLDAFSLYPLKPNCTGRYSRYELTASDPWGSQALAEGEK